MAVFNFETIPMCQLHLTAVMKVSLPSLPSNQRQRRRRSCRTVAPRRLGHLSLDHGAGDPRGAAHGRGLLRGHHGADGGDGDDGARPNGSHGSHGAGDAGEGGGEASAGWEMGRYII